MLYYGRIDVSEGIDVIKTSESKELQYLSLLVFLNEGFQFQPNAFNRSLDLLMMFMNLSDIAILNINGSDYRFIITGNRKSETINLMENTNLQNI